MKKEKILAEKRTEYLSFLALGLVFLVGLAIRYYNRDCLSGDSVACLQPWFEEISAMDFKTSRLTQVGNYNMLYQTMIWILTRVAADSLYAYKILSGIFDVILAIGGFAFLYQLEMKENHGSKKAAIKIGAIAASLIWLTPTVWLNSANWAQCDSIYTSFLIWALVLLLTEKEKSAAFLVGISLAFKLQAIFILPFLFLYLCSKTNFFKRFVKCLAFVILGFFGPMIPNFLAGRPILDAFSIYFTQVGEFPHMTMNYPGFCAFFPDEYNTYKYIGLAFAAVFVFAFYGFFFLKKKKVTNQNMLFLAFFLQYLLVYFLPSMHERYGYCYEILLILFVCQKRKYFGRAILVQLITVKTYLYYLYVINVNLKVGAALHLLMLFSWFITYLCMEEEEVTTQATTDGKAIRKNAGENARKNGKKSVAQGVMEVGLSFKKTLNAFHEKLERLNQSTRLWIDGLIMVLAVLLYFGLCLIKLGSHEAPTTQMHFSRSNGEKEIVLEFDEPHQFQEMKLFLGHEGLKTVSISVFENNEWRVIQGEQKLNSAFCWNEVSFNCYAQFIGIVFLDEDTYVNELVLRDENGEDVLPNNTENYPELFDEQSICPKVNTYYEGTMFDEVYHGRTAYEFLHQLPIYENTHPPLGKSLISIGIALFGMNPFGWRIMCALFGSLMMPFFYLAAKRLTKKRSYGILALLFAFSDFMHYTLSRISTIDVIVACFILAMFYFMYAFLDTKKKPYLLASGIASALAVSTKWTGIYALAGIGVLFLIWLVLECKRTGLTKETIPGYLKLGILCVVCFILIPFGVYTLSYIPFTKVYPDQNLIQHVFSNGKSMLSYHKNVTEGHPYSSNWYTWFFDIKPLVDSRSFVSDTRTSVVATFGNPFLFYAGLVALFYEGYLFIKKKEKTSGGCILLYLSMILPWVFVTRTVFIYQYFVCELLLIVILAHTISKLDTRFRADGKQGLFLSNMGLWSAIVSIGLFILFYPMISGIAASNEYIQTFLMWIPFWNFI